MITEYTPRDLAKILEIIFPQGQWTAKDSEIIAIPEGEEMPTIEQMEAALAEIQAEQAAVTSRATSRAALLQQWDALPAIYRGPYRPEFESANRLLDVGDDEGAAAIIAYAAPKAGFTEIEVATFEAIKSQMAAGIASLSNT